MHAKSQTYEIFVSFMLLVENMLTTKIKAIQWDGGGEFRSHQFRELLTSKGISHRLSCSQTPQQNGVAERKHRHVLEIAHASVPKTFWTNAFTTAIFLINRLLQKLQKISVHGKHYVQINLTTAFCKLLVVPDIPFMALQ